MYGRHNISCIPNTFCEICNYSVKIILFGCSFPCLCYEFVMEDMEVSVVLGGRYCESCLLFLNDIS